MAGDPRANHDLQAQIDDLVRQMTDNRDEIDALTVRADAADARAEAADARAEAADARAEAADANADARADASDARLDAIEARAQVDRDMIADLQRDGVLSQEHAQQMEEALRSSRTIGAAIGLIMASRRVSEKEAFDILVAAASNSHRKLRLVAAELVESAAG